MFLPAPRPPIRRYAMAVLTVAAIAASRLWLDPWVGDGLVLAPLAILAIGASAWYGGAGPGLLAALLAAAAGDVLAAHAGGASPASRISTALLVLVAGALAAALVMHRTLADRLAAARQRGTSTRRVVRRTLSQERLRLQTMLDHIPDYIYFKDHDGRFVACSRFLAECFGVAGPEQVIGRTDFDFFAPEHALPAREDELRIMETGQAMVGKEEFQTWPGGRSGWASTTKVPLRDASGTVIGTFGISRDITERQLALQVLEQAKRAADAASEAKSRFLANMSHEIRTPMSAIVGMTELLIDSGLTPEQQEFARVIEKSGQGLLAMIGDILDVAKIESGRLELEAIPFDLALAVAEIAELHAPGADAKGLELIYRIAPGTPTRLVGDPGRLRQVLGNLVGNALKFTRAGQVFIDVSGAPAAAGRAWLRLTVEDSGIGIAADKQGLIFDTFTQADSSTTREYGGTGLGLAICKEIAEAMGGTISVQSMLGSGSAFTVSLELPIDPGAGCPPPAAPALDGARVLVVEGNPIIQRVIAEQFAAWGCIAQPSPDVAAAVAALRGSDCELALVDGQAGGEADAGLALARAVRADPALAAVGLVMLTSIGRRGDAKAAAEAGFDAYLVKPARMLDLRDALAATRQRRRTGQPSGLITRHSLAEARGHGSSGARRAAGER
jgi:hypothetical protein